MTSLEPISLSSHVLDLQTGAPAAGLHIHLHRDAHAGVLSEAVTDADGRVRDWPAAGELPPGRYRLTFAVGAWFDARGVDSFYDEIVLPFRALEGGAHYHVPLLLSPFGYSTYRGS
ncbi:MAG TPA: hydroxyisourate hydrolase [Pseudomonadales bacterium]|nr:hydroxyisourate hydrolase [Pseudomonadales bacterium]